MNHYIIKKIINPKTNDILEEHEPENVGEPISEEAASEVLDLLGDVVNKKDGTGKKFDIKDYTVGGKTGTAQMPDPDGKGYLTGKNNYVRSEEHTSELQSRGHLVCRLLLEKKKNDDDE